MFSIRSRGSYDDTENFLERMKIRRIVKILEAYGDRGVEALSRATPKDSGETSNSWTYTVVQKGSTISIEWSNSNVVDGQIIAILLQYGHGTKNGGYVVGKDYINPTMKPIFDKIAEDGWRAITQ